MSFTKLFSSITESTIWTEDAHTRLVWITMLAMADARGRVWASIPGLANRARVPVQDAESAIQKFLSPDKYSRTPDREGRRIEIIDGGWRLINHAKHRAVRDEEAIKESKRRYINTRRELERGEEAVENVELCRANAEAESEADTEEDKKKKKRSRLPVSEVRHPIPERYSPWCRGMIQEWVEFKRETWRFNYTVRGWRMFLSDIGDYSEGEVVYAIRKAISCNHQGVYPKKNISADAPTEVEVSGELMTEQDAGRELWSLLEESKKREEEASNAHQG